MKKTLGLFFLLALVNCASDNDGGTAGAGGTGATGGTGGKSGGAGGSGGAPSCTAITGSYLITGARAQPTGSCPNTLMHPGLKGTISGGPKYQLTMNGFPTHPSSGACTVNVTGCAMSASCSMSFSNAPYAATWTSEIAWTITSTGLVGTERWTNYSGTYPSCTAEWTVTGTRQ